MVTNSRHHSPDARQAAIDDYRNSGDTIATVAARHGIGRHHLGAELKAAGLTRRRGPIVARERRDAALADHRNGMTANAVAKKYQLTRHTVRTWIAEEASDDPNELTGGHWTPTKGGIQIWQPCFFDNAQTCNINHQENTNAA